MKAHLLNPQPDLRVIVVHGVEYFVYWDKLDVGASFFLPTTATPRQVKLALGPTLRSLGYEVELRARCEYGRYGVRVWRIT
jgi:hypothetical protein